MADATFDPKLIAKFNQNFQDILEYDRDRYGFITPGDILAGSRSPEEKAVQVADYLRRASLVDLDDNPQTQDVSVYYDDTTTTVAIRSQNQFLPVFSLGLSSGDCYLTYPPDHYVTAIAPVQCGLLRSAHPFLKDLRSEYLRAQTWIMPQDHRVLMGKKELALFNQRLIEKDRETRRKADPKAPATMWNVLNLPENLTYADIFGEKWVVSQRAYTRTPDSFLQSAPFLTKFFQETTFHLPPGSTQLSEDGKSVTISLGVPKTRARIQYGWVVSRSDLRAIPSDTATLDNVSDDDGWQWTGLNAEQPVAIFSEAVDAQGEKWYAVLTTRVWGWVKAKDVALISKQQAIKWTQAKDVLMVTTPQTVVGGKFMEMGTRLRLASPQAVGGNYKVRLSERNQNGKWEERIVSIPEAQVSLEIGKTPFYPGDVPFSRANMVSLLFTYLGHPWGMANERRGDEISFPPQGRRQMYIDCSGILANAFAAMEATSLSRNSLYQAEQGEVVWRKESGETLESALHRVGMSVWFFGMPGHVMFYLGERDGKHWIIHSPGHFRAFRDASEDFQRIGDGRVVVTPIDLNRLNTKITIASGF